MTLSPIDLQSYYFLLCVNLYFHPCHSPFTHRSSFNISFDAGVLVLTSISFFLPEQTSPLPLFLKDIFLGIDKKLAGFFFSFRFFKLCSFTVFWIALFWMRSLQSFLCLSLCVMFIFSLADFETFSSSSLKRAEWLCLPQIHMLNP